MDIDIEQLKDLDAKENEGRGISCVQSVITCLERNDIETAKIVYRNDGDKIRCYPKIQQWFYDNIGCRCHFEKNCDSWLCEDIRRYHDERIKNVK